MLIVVATAEPFGGYHLEPLLNDMLKEKTHEFVYLTPDVNKLQGNGLKTISITSDLLILSQADKVIITGGLYSNWTKLVAEISKLYKKYLVYTELAYLSETNNVVEEKLKPDFFIAMSEHSSKLIAEAFNVDIKEIFVAGSPQLDCCYIPANRNINKKVGASNVLIVSSVDLSIHALELLLLTARHIQNAGGAVTVRTHPRENIDFWTENGITVEDRSRNVYQSLASIDYAVASTGTFNAMLISSGIPIVSFNEANHMEAPKTYSKLTKVIESPEEVLNHETWLEAYKIMTKGKKLAEYLYGPRGNGSQKIINKWVMELTEL